MRAAELQWSLSLPLRQEINLKKGPAIFMNHTLQFTVIIPTFYVSVVHLFMKTAIVLRTVGGSQTTNQLQVKVIVLRTQ